MPINGNRTHPLYRQQAKPAEPDYVEYGIPAPLRFHTMSEGLDQIALAVARLPVNPNPSQRKRLKIIARELSRRAK